MLVKSAGICPHEYTVSVSRFYDFCIMFASITYGQMCADLEEKRYVDYIVAQIFVFVKSDLWRLYPDSK